jgi:hypothetical protein
MSPQCRQKYIASLFRQGTPRGLPESRLSLAIVRLLLRLVLAPTRLLS